MNDTYNFLAELKIVYLYSVLSDEGLNSVFQPNWVVVVQPGLAAVSGTRDGCRSILQSCSQGLGGGSLWSSHRGHLHNTTGRFTNGSSDVIILSCITPPLDIQISKPCGLVLVLVHKSWDGTLWAIKQIETSILSQSWLIWAVDKHRRMIQ